MMIAAFLMAAAGNLSVSIAPNMMSTASQFMYGAFTTPSVSVLVAGGSGSYSYAWTWITPDDVSIDAPSAATTTFTWGLMLIYVFHTAVARCTVTDSVTGAVAFADLPVQHGFYP